MKIELDVNNNLYSKVNLDTAKISLSTRGGIIWFYLDVRELHTMLKDLEILYNKFEVK